MINRLRIISARLVTRWPPGLRGLVVRAWAWLCANTNDLAEKQRCLEAILELEPGLEQVQVAFWRACGIVNRR